MRVALIDGNHALRRAYHVMEGLSDSEGHATGGIFGFMSIIKTTLQALIPDHFIVIWDGGLDPERRVRFESYKDRSEADPEKEKERQMHREAVAWQANQLSQELLPLFGIHDIRLPHTEADDLIYGARELVLKPLGVTSIIVSGDKDFYQMVAPLTEVYSPMDKKKNNPMDLTVSTLNARNFKETMGLTPAQYLDLRAIVGDTSDHIPGVKGVGEVTATKMLQGFGSIRSILKQSASFSAKGKRYRDVIANKDTIVRNLVLMGLQFRTPKAGEAELLRDTIMAASTPPQRKHIKQYCLAKTALDFITKLPEYYQLLETQQKRSQRFHVWAASKERRSS